MAVSKQCKSSSFCMCAVLDSPEISVLIKRGKNEFKGCVVRGVTQTPAGDEARGGGS